MRRLFWAALGAAVGVLVVRRVTKAAHAYTPAGLAEGLSNLGDAVRDFGDRVANAMAEREVELRDALELNDSIDGIVKHSNEGRGL